MSPAVCIDNKQRESKEKGGEGRERLPLLPSSTATRQLSGILYSSRTLEDKSPAQCPTTKEISMESLEIGISKKTSLKSLFPEEVYHTVEYAQVY